MNCRAHKSGFTLVELLVVITIIGILIALLLPAVQAARESARKMQCTNNLKQLALGCLAHEQSQGFLPTAGWNYVWIGDPDRGFDRRQPGGWIYNILPFIEEPALHDIGAGMSLANKKVAFMQMAQTPLTCLNCPTRRPPVLYPNQAAQCNVNAVANAPHTDYAGNGGTISPGFGWPTGSGDPADADAPGFAWPTYPLYTGVFVSGATIRIPDITDGASNTYLLGEKYLTPDFYTNGLDGADNNTIYVGWDWDNIRWSIFTAATSSVPAHYTSPSQDTPGIDDLYDFGSAHAGSFNMALCDGSVRSISYTIDATTHGHLCDRKDGVPVDASKL